VIRALKEAEEYPGPSLVIAFASCISHGLSGGMRYSQEEERLAVETGYWLNYRYDPRKKAEGKNPFILDSKEPTKNVEEFLKTQVRYNYLLKTHPEDAKKLHLELAAHIKERYEMFKKMSENL
jgi:pyruvate-ferredoxin/flavodoxin oxidoreductase